MSMRRSPVVVVALALVGFLLGALAGCKHDDVKCSRQDVQDSGTTVVSGQSGQAPASPFCQRTPQVRDAITRAACPKCSCESITPDHLKLVRELSLAGTGLTALRSGDLSGLTSLEKLELTGTRLEVLPEGLPAELRALKRLRLELSLLSRLSESVIQPLLDRPGFVWEVPSPTRTCDRYEPKAEKAPVLSTSALEAALQLAPTHGELDVRAWKARRGVYLVGVPNDSEQLDLFAVSVDADKQPALLAKAEQPIRLPEGYDHAFDLAPYRITGTEVGFGLRLSHEEPVPNNQTASEEELQVFRIHGNKIERVLKTVVYRKYIRHGPPTVLVNEEGVDPGDWQWEDRFCSVIAVTGSKTNGVFNWVKVNSAQSTKPDTARDASTEVLPAVVFRWTGERYEARNDEKESYFFRED